MGGNDIRAGRGNLALAGTQFGDGARKGLRQGPCLDPQSRTDLGGFAEGTEIDTASGPCQIEHLQPGDLIRTVEHGLLPVQQIWAIPKEAAPQTLLRLRASGPAGVALYVLPSQCLRLTHWVCQRLFSGRPGGAA